MATAVINNVADPRVIYKTQYTSVWVKAYYGDDWIYVPYLFPEQSTEAAAPTDSDATLTWDYGKYVNLWSDPGSTLLPINIENWHVQILCHTIYGTYIAWIGVVVGESITETGIDVNTGLPRGEQIIECRGLEFLLERRCVVGTYVGNATEYTYMPRTWDFNVAASRREDLAGNRSAQVNQTSGTFLFSSDGNKWSNYNIIQYLLSAFQPWYAFESEDGQLFYAPQFRLSGQTSGLRQIFEEHRLSGKTLRESLNSLIDRKRGFGWKIKTDGVGTIYIHVFSLAQYAIVGNETSLPANPRQIDVAIHDDEFIQARYRISSTSQVDQIVVESESPVKTCATLRFSNGTLEPAWDPELDAEFALNATEQAYKTLADELYTNFDDIKIYAVPNMSFQEFQLWSQSNPTNFAFLLTGDSTPMEELLIGFNVLDADGDNFISKNDLLLFTTETDYQSVTEEVRATDKYAAVFSHFRVPKTWTWTQGWAPYIYGAGWIHPTRTGAFWNHDTPFERHLPFMEPGSSLGTEREYLEPFAVLEKPNENRTFLLALAEDGAGSYDFAAAQAVYPALTNTLFEVHDNGSNLITWTEIATGLTDNPPKYFQMDRAEQLDYPPMSIRMGDSGMKIVIKSQANHVFAFGHEEGGTFDVDPQFDYLTLAATVFFETAVMPRVIIPIFTNIVRNEDGTITTQSSPIGKQIYIRVPGKEVWVAADYTVTGLDGEDLVFYNGGSRGILRDDTGDLRAVAMLAYVWYYQQRASVDMTIQNQLPFFQVGDLIRSTLSGWSFQRIGTCVTSIQRNYQLGTHNVSTGYAELDPVAFVGKFGQ